jgi:hypothetical protein
MKNFRRILAGVATVMIGVSTLMADQISGGTQSAGPTTFDYGDGAPDPFVSVTFNQFICPVANCTLTGIEFDVNGTVNDNYSITNTNGAAKQFTVDTSGSILLENSAETLSFTETEPFHDLNTIVQGTGCGAPPCNTSAGSDTATASAAAIYSVIGSTGTLASYTDTGHGMASNLTTPISVTPFLGSGTINLEVAGMFDSTVSGSGNTSTTSGNGSETVTVLYDFTVPSSTPEPATFALFSGALLAIGLYRKKVVR